MELTNSHILVVHSAGGLRTFKLTKACYTIGRSKKADIYLDDNGCSRHHATLIRMGEGEDTYYLLIDGNLKKSKPSANGTYVNNERITAHRLKHKDCTRFGSPQNLASYLCVSHARIQHLDLHTIVVEESIGRMGGSGVVSVAPDGEAVLLGDRQVA